MIASPVDGSAVGPAAANDSRRGSEDRTRRSPIQEGSFGALLAAVQVPGALSISRRKSVLPQVRDDRSASGGGARQRRLSTLRRDDAQGRLPSDSRIAAATQSAAAQAAKEAATSRRAVAPERATAKQSDSPRAESTDSSAGTVETNAADRRTAAVTTTSRDSTRAAVPTNGNEQKTTSSRVIPSAGRASDDVGSAPATTGAGRGTPSAGRRASDAAAVVATKAESATSGIRTAALRTQGAAGRPTADNAVQLRGRGDRSEATGRSVAKPSAAKGNASANRAPRDEITQRIARVVQAKVSGKDTIARIRLDPPELGTVRVNLHLKSDSVVVRLVADNADARDTMMSRLDDLRNALQQQGVRVDRLEVTMPSQGEAAAESFVPDQTANHAGEGRRPGGQGRRRGAWAHGIESPVEGGEAMSDMFASVGSDDVIALRNGLDIRV